MIEAKNISHTYNSEEVLHNISLAIKEHEFVALVGKSGSGKSTLLSILSTLLKPSKGSLKLLDQDTTQLKYIDEFRRENIGFVFQFHYLIHYLNVYENITLAMYERYKQDVDQLLKDLDIYELKERYPHEISGGQRQRVAIARALINRPKIIFADEPTGNLDSVNSQNVFSLLKKIVDTQGVSVVVATHDLDQAHNANTIYEIQDGHISTYR